MNKTIEVVGTIVIGAGLAILWGGNTYLIGLASQKGVHWAIWVGFMIFNAMLLFGIWDLIRDFTRRWLVVLFILTFLIVGITVGKIMVQFGWY